MKKNRFYVDYENVHDAGLEGLDALKAEDEVYVFYSTAAKSIHMDKVAVLTNSPAKVQLIEADTGTKNSLDFQLLTFLFGKMEEDATHIIISGDKGFEAAIKMAERIGLPTVKRTLSIKDATAKKGGIAALKKAAAKAGAKAGLKANRKSDAGKALAKADGKTSEKTDAKDLPEDAPKKGAKKKDAKAKASKSDEQPKKSKATAEGKQDTATKQASTPAKDEALQPAGAESPQPDEPLSTTKRAQRERVQAFLESKGLELDKGSITVVMNALTGSDDKQSFYLVFLKALGQKKGLDLYHQVKPYFLELRKLLG